MKFNGVGIVFKTLLILQISAVQQLPQNKQDDIPSISSKNASRPVVHTSVGAIRGLWAEDGAYSMFMGIPYAKLDPDNVFGSAIPNPVFEEIFDADDDSAVCPQEKDKIKIAGTLDCLHLNIYVPNSASTENLLPVMVYIFGGYFNVGYPSRSVYGPSFIVRQDIILVTINYRLGPYGFMCLETPEVPGNQGLKDQVKALRWIRENILAFGGDNTKVTLVGNSSGAMSVDLHWYFNEEPLFHRLILQSGVAVINDAIMDPIPTAPFKLAGLLNYTTNDLNDALSFLNSVDPLQLIAVSKISGLHFGPCVEKQFLNVDNFITKHPINIQIKARRVHNVDILMGFNNDESYSNCISLSKDKFDGVDHLRHVIDGYFDFKGENKLYDDIIQIVKHFYFGDADQSSDDRRPVADLMSNFIYQHPMLRTVQKYLDNGIENLYFYLFSYTGGRNYIKYIDNVTTGGAAHADELGYLFDMSYFKKPLEAQDKLIMERMTELWANFVKYGNPTPQLTDLIPLLWPRVTQENLYYLQIDKKLQVDTRPLRERMSFVDLIYRMCGQYQRGLESSADKHIFMNPHLLFAIVFGVITLHTFAVCTHK